MKRSFLVLAGLLVLGCSGPARTVRTGGGGGGGGGGEVAEATPVVEYIGPENATPAPDGSVELLFTRPSRPAGDLGTIRVTCTGNNNQGCSYRTASAAMMQKAQEIKASGVHSIVESSGNVSAPMATVAAQNLRVYVLAGTAFAYSP